MTPPPTLLIFDVDGTLTYSAGLTRVAIDRAVQEIYGVNHATQDVNPRGRTDPAIFRDILERRSLTTADFPAQFHRYTARYLEILRNLIARTDRARAHPGVPSLLERLHAEPWAYLALGTGNVPEAAYLKLGKHNLSRYFPVGGFGSDGEDRAEVLRFAVLRAKQYYRQPFTPDSTWVIGDTPHDVAAGKAIGAHTLAVGTGDYPLPELHAAGADLVLPDLSDTEGFLSLIINHRR